jgi:ATP-dependent DNA ligase
MASTSVVITDYTTLPGGLNQAGTAWLFPKVTSVNAHGRPTEWRIVVRAFRNAPGITLPFVPEDAFLPFDLAYLQNKPLDPQIAGFYTVESRIGENGKIKKTTPTVVTKGLNKGKQNETNTICQAMRDALGKHNKQMKKAKTEPTGGNTERFPPMLAKVASDVAIPYSDGVFVQPKYNGLRAMSTYDVIEGTPVCIMYSRKKLLFPGFSYIKDELFPVLAEYWNAGTRLYLDGEIYKHGMALQDISGLARRGVEPGQPNADIDYMVYDLFVANEPEMTYLARLELLNKIFDRVKFTHVKLVPTRVADSAAEVDAAYKEFLAMDFEGAMVRLDAKYVPSYNDYHCAFLLKIKPTFDAEYEIIGWTTGTNGKAMGALMMKCKTAKGETFDVTPAMELPDRMELAKKMPVVEANGKTHFENHYLGKPLIVYFDEKSKSDVPQRGRTKMEIRTWD